MKNLTIISTVILSTAVITGAILRTNSSLPSAVPNVATPTSQELLALQNQITTLAEQLAQTNTTLIQMAQNTPIQPNKEADTSYVIYPDQEAQLVVAPPPPMTPYEQRESAKRPKIVMVDPTPMQQQSYEVLKAQLDDITFVSNLSMHEFSSLPEVQVLPKPLQLVLLSKLIEHYNRGNISEDTFLGIELMQQNQ